MKSLLIALSFLVLSLPCKAFPQTLVWQPSPGHKQIPIWPSTPPDPLPVKGPEFASQSTAPKFGPSL
jgi:hypothetical protein